MSSLLLIGRSVDCALRPFVDKDKGMSCMDSSFLSNTNTLPLSLCPTVIITEGNHVHAHRGSIDEDEFCI